MSSLTVNACAAATGVLLVGAVCAQSPSPLPPCQSPAHAQFDFWVGQWDLRWTDQSGREVAGFNRISRIHGGCVILEEFDGRDGTPLRGTSVSSYDATAGRWRQVWVDNQGSWLDFEGGIADGDPAFSHRVPARGAGGWQRMVFRDIKSDSLTWDWERSIDNGMTWSRQWRIQYTRRR
jgi:hypothetical protein